ncbi:alcohol dehydrogenase catalytic domain-containing protein [Solihabitans fulvus]|uniref:Alcohol dehydrogenase catalytic domain-containing protein n=1 Tax=Solihabitans fulvus TaxID=1892852 RepID=A0A5B2WNL5_9PSEU|nr:alcohol dehydrogenase catalytic domain-containing protein [Solihabitans fulvus]KAA2252578.1 alcohol dehydrogenase catalytic domain-containing protein [Solihabitans fulvus]
MRGVVYDGEQLRIVDDLTVREPGPGEVLVRLAAAGVCHSDVSVLTGAIPFPVPVVLGHEGAGVVAAAGPGVAHVAAGDHVVLSTLANCGACAECGRGRPTMCRSTFGNRPTPFTWRDRPTHSFAATSTFVEHTVVQASQVVRVPVELPLTSAALIGCAVVTGVGAVLNRARVAALDTAIVIGVGGVGLNVVQGCRLARAARIVAVDNNPAKEEIARAFGATDFVDTTGVDPVAAVREVLPSGADHVFECVGSPELIRASVDLLDWHGQLVLVGVPPSGTEMSVPVAPMYLDRSILGLRYGATSPHTDIPRYVEFYRSGDLLIDELVSKTYPLENLETIIGDMAEGTVARGVLTF